MKPAFFWSQSLPPPPSDTDILVSCNGSRAASAADAAITVILQLIIGDVVCQYVFPDPLFVPVRQRIQFINTVVHIPFNHLDLFTRVCLTASKPGNPCIHCTQHFLQWPYFSDLTALLAVFDIFVKKVWPSAGNKLVKVMRMGRIYLVFDSILIHCFLHHFVCFLEKPPCINGENSYTGIYFHQNICDNLAFQAECRRKGDTICAEFTQCPFQDLGNGFPLHFFFMFFEFFHFLLPG